nr:acyl-carrier protein [Streptomyces sp. WM6386]
MDENRPPVGDTVRSAFASELFLPLGKVTGDTPLTELAGLDSVKLLRVVAALEMQYAITLDDEQLYDLGTVEDVAVLVEKALETSAVSGG